jgi:hypothetical protein
MRRGQKMNNRPLWKGRRPSQKITVKSIHRKPGQGAGGREIFQPWESHLDWELFGVPGPTPTIFDEKDNSVSLVEPISSGSWYPVMNVKHGIIDACEMSCVMGYEGATTNFETYMLAKGIDENNFVGATSYNNRIMLYERVNSNWNAIGIETPVSGTLGKEVKITIAGDQITLFVDGLDIGTGTTGITGLAYMGSLLRGTPISGLLWSNMILSGSGADIVTYKAKPVTLNTLPVNYNA